EGDEKSSDEMSPAFSTRRGRNLTACSTPLSNPNFCGHGAKPPLLSASVSGRFGRLLMKDKSPAFAFDVRCGMTRQLSGRGYRHKTSALPPVIIHKKTLEVRGRFG